ncbi:hypothetical protein EMIT048CA2_20236 [Pseudomonas chlororaphis]
MERQRFSRGTSGGAQPVRQWKKAYSWLMFLSNILFDLIDMFHDLMRRSWNCVTCVTSSRWPKSCISAAPPRFWASPNRP